jgi:hypothetical protein
MKYIALIVCSVMILISLEGCFLVGDDGPPEACLNAQPLSDSRFWLDGPQIYTNIAIPLEKACRMGITVNGLWNGWGMKSPVASMHPEMIFWRFKNDQEYVDGIHEAGMLHGSTLSSVYAHEHTIKKHPDLKQAICRTITGDTFQMEGGWYLGNFPFMCQNSPLWQEALLDRAKKMIDAETDAIVFDEPFGDTFFGSLPFPEFPGFSEIDLMLLAEDLKQNFTPEELTNRFGVSNPEPEKLREQFAQADLMEWSDQEISPTEHLWRHFRQLQMQKNLESKKRLVDAIRQYSIDVRGEAIPIGANLAELEAYSFLSLQLPVLYLAELCDFLAFEMAYRPALDNRNSLEGKEAFVLSSRGKWVPWYKLGEAIVGSHRSLAYPSQEMVDVWMEKYRKINYLCHLFAEAYAAQGGLIIPFADFGDKGEKVLRRYTQFVRQHIDLFERSEIFAPIGVLYSHGENTTSQHWSYLGVAQALYEAGLPYSVIYTTSDSARWGTLSRSKLKQYPALILPLVSGLNQAQRDVVLEYANEDGGFVMLFEADHGFPISREPGFHPYGTGGFIMMKNESKETTLGEAYYTNYSDDIRKQLAETVLKYLPEGSPVLLPQTQREWAAIAYAQSEENRAVIHVLNYDYDPEQDYFRPKRNVILRVKTSAFGLSQENTVLCTGYSPERDTPIKLSCRHIEGYLELKIPELSIYEVLVIKGGKDFSP